MRIIKYIAIIILTISILPSVSFAYKWTDDTYANDQYYIGTLRIDKLWNDINLFNRKKVIVAIIDDGIYQNHPELIGSLWNNTDEVQGNGIDDDNNGYIDDYLGYNFLNHTNDVTQIGPHGTAIAGLIAAPRNDKYGIAGVTSYATLMPLIACNSTVCKDESIIEGIYYAVNNGARIINLSLGSMLTNGYSDKFNEAIKYAYNNNVVIIASAGNGDPNGGIGYDTSTIPQSPVCNDNGQNMVIGVASSTQKGSYRTNWTNYGVCIDTFAPGENLTSTFAPTSNDYYFYSKDLNGTSFSTPIVVGIIAEILSSYHDLSNKALYSYIDKASRDGQSRGNIDAYALANYIQINQNNLNYKKNDNFTGIRYYQNPYKITHEPEEKPNTLIVNELFNDISLGYKYIDAIRYVKSKGIVQGYGDGSYRPYNSINRAEFTKIIMEVKYSNIPKSTSSCFKDVSLNEWFADYVCYAKEQGVIGGYPDGTFKAGNEINIAEALKITLETFFGNIPLANGEWYEKYINYAKNKGFYLNDEWTTNIDKITRGEMAELIYLITK